MNKDFITLSPEEKELVEQMNLKYPGMSFELQAVIPARYNEIRDFMRSHLDDPEAQRAAILSGGNWEGARTAYESLCAAQNEFFINYFEEHHLPYPRIPRDAHKSFINRRFADSEYSEVKRRRDDAQADVRLLNDKVEQLARNARFLITTVEDLKLDVLMDRNNAAETLQKIDEIVQAFAAQGVRSKTKAKGRGSASDKDDDVQEFGQVVDLTREEIDAKLGKREQGQADRAAEEEALRKREAYQVMRTAFPDADKFFRMLDEVGSYPKFADAFRYCLLPYIQQGDYMPTKLPWMVQAEKLHPWCTGFNGSVTPDSLRKYLREACDDYLSGSKKG